MTRKFLFAGAAILALGLNSCNTEKETTLCDCIELQAQILEESKDLDFGDPKMKEIEEQYAEQMEACEIIGENLQKEFDELSNEEAMKKQEEMFQDCPAFEKVQALMNEQMKKYEEQMQNLNFDEFEEELSSGLEGEMMDIDQE